MTQQETPTPGTQAALDAGCICPWLDNRDRQPDGPFVYVQGCPVHPWPEDVEPSKDLSQILEQAQQDLGGRVEIEGVGE